MSEDDKNFDLVTIGAGPGGYVCAIRAAQLGMRAACIDAREAPGGTCLNVGCIPSKALLHASHLYAARETLSSFGVLIKKSALDLPAMMRFKEEGVAANTKGVAYLLKKNKVEYFHATARIAEKGVVALTPESGGAEEMIKAKHIVIATGSEPIAIAGLDMDEDGILSSTGALSLSSVPRNLLVVGAGYIGLELGSVWQRLGAEVTIVEAEERIAPGMDAELARGLHRLLEKQGLSFKVGHVVEKVEGRRGKYSVTLSKAGKNNDEKTSLSAERVLLSVGRKACTKGLGLEALGVGLDEKGFIIIDEACRSSVEGIYAIGDVAGGALLAHKASEEGVVLAENLCGTKARINPLAIPSVIYTHPEAASVGKTEDTLKSEGVFYKVGRFPFTANGRAKVMGESDGFVKILADKETDRILGVHILGAEAGLMIAQAVTAIEFGASSEDIARTIHAHPTLSEAMKEAALLADGHPIHM